MIPHYANYEWLIGKADPGYSYGFIWATPKLYDLYVANGDNERFTWNIAPFTYRRIADRTDLGIVGRTFENKALYDLVKGAGWYGDRSYNYEGANEGEEYNSKVEQIGYRTKGNGKVHSAEACTFD